MDGKKNIKKMAGIIYFSAFFARIGIVIEIPGADLTADKIAGETRFFSFGTNDLTQLTFGLSRDDAGKILNDYLERNIFECDPTARLDQVWVGQLGSVHIK